MSPRLLLALGCLWASAASAEVAGDHIFFDHFCASNRDLQACAGPSSTAAIFHASGIHYYHGCEPRYVDGGSAWIVQAQCQVDVQPLPPGWSPGGGSFVSRLTLDESGAWLNCEVIEYNDDRVAGTWWLLAECQ